MALIRFEHFDPVSNMLALQQELDRFLRNPSFNLGVSGQGSYPPVNIFDDKDGVVVIAELAGMDAGSIKVSGQGTTLTLSGSRIPMREPIQAPIIGASVASASSLARSNSGRVSTSLKPRRVRRPES